MHSLQISFTTFYTIAALVALFLVAPVTVSASFSDTNNQADAGRLSAGAVAATFTPDTAAGAVEAGTVNTLTLTTDDASTLGTQSRLSFALQSCQTDFYTNILLEVTTASGTTAGTFADAAISETDVPGTYTLDVIAGPDLVAVAGEECVIEATLETWQTAFAEPNTGFRSIDIATITLTTPDPVGAQETSTVVLNELYPAVLSTTTVPLEREWVELYNGTDSAVDVAGWRIDEYISGDTANASRPHTIVSSCASVSTVSDHMQPLGTTDTVIPAGSFLVVEFCGSSSYMSDGGDTIELYNAALTQVDTHTYPATANGKSHARIPDGAAWVDPVPTPGNKNSATRADLEAEGWDEATIDSTLALLAADTVTDTETTTSQTTSSDGSQTQSLSGNAGAATTSTSTAASSSAQIASTTAATTTASVDGTQTPVSATTSASSAATASTTTKTKSTSTSTATSSIPSGESSAPADSTGDGTQTVATPPATTTKPAEPDDETVGTESVEGAEPPSEDAAADDNSADTNDAHTDRNDDEQSGPAGETDDDTSANTDTETDTSTESGDTTNETAN